jgi:hypothetical protein
MKKAYQLAQNNSQASHESNAKYQKVQRFKPFNVGDLVFLKNNYRVGSGAKFKFLWIGPYRISNEISPVNYEITPLYDRNRRIQCVHINRLKPCRTPFNLLPEYEIEKNNEPFDNEDDDPLNKDDDVDSDSEPDNDQIIIRNRQVPNPDPLPNLPPYNLRSHGSVAEQTWIPDRPLEFRR